MAAKDGVDLLLFPCGQFGNQELKTDVEIKKFVAKQGLGDKPNVHVITKGDVIGGKAHPAWKLFYEETNSFESHQQPSWNFQGKFIIGKTGEVRRVPRGGNVAQIIDELLAQ